MRNAHAFMAFPSPCRSYNKVGARWPFVQGQPFPSSISHTFPFSFCREGLGGKGGGRICLAGRKRRPRWRDERELDHKAREPTRSLPSPSPPLSPFLARISIFPLNIVTIEVVVYQIPTGLAESWVWGEPKHSATQRLRTGRER